MRYIICAALALAVLLGSCAYAEEEAWIIDDSEVSTVDPHWYDEATYRLLETKPLYLDATGEELSLELWITDYSGLSGFPPPPTLEYAFIMDGDEFIQQLSIDIGYWGKTNEFLKYIDANFDGYRDLLFCTDIRTVDGYQYWLWNQLEGKFIMSETFSAMASHPFFYSDAKRIGCYNSYQSGNQINGYLYEVVGDTVVLLKEIEKTSDDNQPLEWIDIEALLWEE